MDIVKYIQHPELLDRETLYPLRELVAKYPYFQAARLLFLHNLFLLHDPTFGEELRRASLYISDRNVLFQLVEGDNYKPTRAHNHQASKEAALETGKDRTESLINKFLKTSEPYSQETHKRQPTATDATTDYAAFLLQMEDAQPEQQETPSQRGLTLIDDFIENQIILIILPVFILIVFRSKFFSIKNNTNTFMLVFFVPLVLLKFWSNDIRYL